MKPLLDKTPRVPNDITHNRINNFLASNGQFYRMGIHSRLWKLRYSGEPYVKLSVYSVPHLKEATSHKFTPIKANEFKAGPSWSTHWIKVDISIPYNLANHPIVFQWDMGCEGLVWSSHGEPLQGLTGGTDQSRHDFILTQNAKSGQTFSFYIENACNGMFGVGKGDTMVPDPNKYFIIQKADLVVPDYQVQALYHDLTIIKGIAYDTFNESVRARTALAVANEVINHFSHDSKSIDHCLKITKDFLSDKGGTGQHQVTAIGNCHIDTAWLWPFDETKRKIARSWSSQLDLMERYPDFIFTGSQVQQYEWLKQLYPSLFDKIKKKEKSGKWEIIGGSWVEHVVKAYAAKCYLVNVFTNNILEKELKLLKQSGCDYFFTQKLSWNNINKFPLTTFFWTGIDGSSVLTHLTPADTYGAEITPSELHKCEKNHHDIEYSNQSLLAFGHGDGGGGATPEMLERLKRVKNIDGLPSCKPGRVDDFFKSIEKNSKKLQSYRGELYLEFHRGTYTTQALVKLGNRQCEVLIRDLELLATYARLFTKKKKEFNYPQSDINRLWKLICLNQFHDCIPGSAIGLAYVDVHKFHREVIYETLKLRREAQDYIISNNKKDLADSPEEGLIVFNTLPWSRSCIVSVPGKDTQWVDQQEEDGHELVFVENVPGFGAVGILGKNILPVKYEDGARAYQLDTGEFVLENNNLKAVFESNGNLLKLFDKHSDRGNLVDHGTKGNVLQLYEDVPIYWDAWDVEIYHLQKFKTLNSNKNLKIVSDGPLHAKLKFHQKISHKSWIEQTIGLTSTGSYIEFENAVEWREDHQFLKVEFNWDIISDFATYDIQYGAIKRPTHFNTTLDSARFEVCGHKFADLSDANYGIALLNNCKYGYATHGKSQRLSLLRSPKNPDDHADMGQHKFKYAIYPHKGDFTSSDVVSKALEFNVPLSVRQTNQLDSTGIALPSLFTIEPAGRVIIDTVKLGEDDKNKGKSVILRIYEAYGGKSNVILTSSLDIEKIMISNVLEDDTNQFINQQDNHYRLTLTPFQILTLKVHLI
ncbi:galactose mutarotase-like domain-containing protein [Cunninghamella echinulata]|nr:galactose mutarotase-like domain-containing protein [Cunninghamella echinulata]